MSDESFYNSYKEIPSISVISASIGLREPICRNWYYNIILLQRLNYLLTSARSNNHIFEGHKWIYNTYEQWQKQFPFWSKRTLERTITNLERMGLLLSRLGKIQKGRLKYYTINYEALASLLKQKRIALNVEDLKQLQANREECG